MTENELKNLLAAVTPPDEAARAAAHAHWAALAKPLGGLGRLEAMVEDAAALTGDPVPDVSRRAVLVLCADNGVVAQGVSQTDASVTRAVLEKLTARRTSVCRMAAAAHCDVVPVDMGIAGAPVPGAADCRIAAGTADFTTGPAMTRAQAVQAIAAGIALVRAQKQSGAQLLATGEMGIGNTTTSSAVASVLLGRPVSEMTGRGAGLSDAGLHRKIDAIERGIARNHPDAADPLGVLAALGGFDIAGLCGVFLGGALERLPIVMDGFISGVAALRKRPFSPAMCPASQPHILCWTRCAKNRLSPQSCIWARVRARWPACRCGIWHWPSTTAATRLRRAASRRTPRSADAGHRRRGQRQKRLCGVTLPARTAAAHLSGDDAGMGRRVRRPRGEAPRHAG